MVLVMVSTIVFTFYFFVCLSKWSTFKTIFFLFNVSNKTGSTSSSSVPRFTNNITNDSSTGGATGQQHNRISFTIVLVPILIAMLLLPVRLKF